MVIPALGSPILPDDLVVPALASVSRALAGTISKYGRAALTPKARPASCLLAAKLLCKALLVPDSSSSPLSALASAAPASAVPASAEPEASPPEAAGDLDDENTNGAVFGS